MRIPSAVALLALFVALPAQGHEMWLQPSAFTVAPGEPVGITLLVGDAADVKPWKFAWEKLNSFRSYGPEGMRDEQATIGTIAKGGIIAPAPSWQAAGTHLLAFESNHQPHSMVAAKFNAYLKEDGLEAVVDARRRAGTTGRPGREIYSRRTKALIQVGATPTDGILQPIGQTLELVPEHNPYSPGSDTKFPVRTLFQGRALPGALVALTALATGSKPIQKQITDAEGRAVFDVARRGGWMVSVVWSRPIENNKAAEFETIFTSLTFGYPGSHGTRP